jgi:hypothetical protein
VEQLVANLAEKYGDAVAVSFDPRTAPLAEGASEEQVAEREQKLAWWTGSPMGGFYGADGNKPYRLTVAGTVVYDRLNEDGTNKVDGEDPQPSDEAVQQFGERGGRVRFWGPIIPAEGNKFWGGLTPGKLKLVHDAIDMALAE